MRTVIRLQNHGCRNHPYWWIVIMGHYKNPKGRFIEHVGYWIPMKRATVQRSIILNKPRIQYWLAMGAQPSKPVNRMLSYIDFMPKPLIPYGSSTLYEKPKKPDHRRGTGLSVKVGPYTALYNAQTEREELNMTIREVKTQFELEKNIDHANNKLDDVEIYESDIEDADKRTNQFYLLKQKFAEMENDTKKLNTHKREIIIRKLNKLASQGIQEQPQKINQRPIKIREFMSADEDNPEVFAKNKLKYLKLIEELELQKAKAEKEKQLLAPMTKHELKSLLVKNHGFSLYAAENTSNRLFKALPSVNVSDYLDLNIDPSHYQKLGTLKKIPVEVQEKEPVYIPTPKTITPFPDITSYDPTNYYENRPGYSELPNPNKAYMSYKDNTRTSKSMGKIKLRYKHNKGRKTKRRVFFSTLKPNISDRANKIAFACQPSLTNAYTGLMRKIGC